MRPNRKLKKPDSCSKLILKEVIGLTTKNANGLASNGFSPNCVYVAGCVLVVYNVETDTQSHLMVSSRTPKPLSCVSMSQDGSFVAAGESGHQPAVLVWNCTSMTILSELKSHQYGVTCTGFSPDGKFLVSVGFPHDGYICLWDWRSGVLVTKVKEGSSCSSVESVGFSADAKFIVTAGKKHLKLWKAGSSTRLRSNVGVKSLSMHGKPITIGFQKGYSFIAVTSPPILINSSLVNGDQAGEILPIYALTNTGVLCLLRSGWSIRNSVDLKVKKAFALSASSKLIACACNNGVVKLYTTEFLEYTGSLRYTEVKRCMKAEDTDCQGKARKNELQSFSTLPHALACQFSTSEKLVVVYEDHSLYIWDIHDVGKATRCCVLVSHGASIWDIKNLPCENMHDPYLACAARGCSGGVSFATCSADGTIRLWDLALQPVNDPTLATMHNCLLTNPGEATCLVSAGIFERDSLDLGISTPGFRSIAISSDGQYLAAGDCRGNLHIYNIYTSEYICFQETHDSEILSLSFSLSSKKNDLSKESFESHYFLASGGLDRMIHLYDVNRNFDVIGSVDDHSAAVTSVKLTSNGCKILSCSADRTLALHDVAITETGCIISRLYHQMATYGTVCDMAVDPTMEVAVTVTQDMKINALKIATGKLIRSFKQDSDLGDPVKVIVDPSCSFLVCSYSNRSICMYDFFTGEIVARAVGHGEVVTGLIFLPDCKHIVSVTGDGCIYVWEVPALLSSKMLHKIKENSRSFTPTSTVPPLSSIQFKFHEEEDHQCKIHPKEVTLPESSKPISQRQFWQGVSLPETSAFKFSISRLPKWARAKGTGPRVTPTDPNYTSSQQVGLQVFSPTMDSHGGHDVQTPSKHRVKGREPFFGSMSRYSSDNDTSQGSRTSQEIHRRSFALDRRWLTIHNVCLDLLNSPDVWDMKEMKGMKALVDISTKDPVMEKSDTEVTEASSRTPSLNNPSMESTFGFSDHVYGRVASLAEHSRLHNSGSASDKSDRLQINSATACHEVAVSEVPKQFQPKTTERRVQTMIDVNGSCIKSREKDPFKRNLGNLSAKMKTGERKSSAKRIFSGQFVLRRDLLRGHKKLFETPDQDFGGESMKRGKESTSYVPLGDLQILVPEESQRIDTCEQDLKTLLPKLLSSDSIHSQRDSADCSSIYHSGNLVPVNVREEKESSFEGCEKHRTIIACKGALLNLETAAEKLFRLISRLGTLDNGEENTSVSQVQLYSEATEMLPQIAKKVHAVAKLVQSTNIPSEITEVNVSSFEPLVGTFAESISQRVVEILKNDCSNL